MADSSNNLVKKLSGLRSSDHQICHKLKKAKACIKAHGVQVEGAESKYARMVEDAAQATGDFCARTALSELSTRAEKGRIARLKKNLDVGVAEEQNALASQQEAYNAVRFQLTECKEALHAVRAMLTAATSELERLFLTVEGFKKKLMATKADGALQAMLPDASRGQMDAKVAELNKVQSCL